MIPKRLGFRARETMRGTHRFLENFDAGDGSPTARAGAEHPFEFSVSWGHPNLVRFANPLSNDFCCAVAEGTLSAGGICEAAPATGLLEFRYLSESLIRYTLDFEARSKQFHYVGEKRELRPWNLHRTHVTCYGTLMMGGSEKPVSHSVVQFSLSDLPSFLRSFHLE
jgi:hypothetical protein